MRFERIRGWVLLGVCLLAATTSRAQDRTQFEYTDSNGREGTFTRSANGEWVEKTGTGEKHIFRLVSENKEYIELYDPKRGGVGVRLARDESLWKHPTLTNGEWRKLWKGEWQVPDDSVPRTAAQFKAAEDFEFEGVSLSLKLDDFLKKFPGAKLVKTEAASSEIRLNTYFILSEKATLIEVLFANKKAIRVVIDYTENKRKAAGGDEKLIQRLTQQFGEPEKKAKEYDRHWRLQFPGKSGCYVVTQNADKEAFSIAVWDHLSWAVVQATRTNAKK